MNVTLLTLQKVVLPKMVKTLLNTLYKKPDRLFFVNGWMAGVALGEFTQNWFFSISFLLNMG